VVPLSEGPAPEAIPSDRNPQEASVAKGVKSGTGTAETEAGAYAAAKADLTPAEKAGK